MDRDQLDNDLTMDIRGKVHAEDRGYEDKDPHSLVLPAIQLFEVIRNELGQLPMFKNSS